MSTYDSVRLLRQFQAVHHRFSSEFVTAKAVPVQSWQSTKAPQPMPEIRNASFTLDLDGCEDLEVLRDAIQPNLPWADNHFVQERVSGHPLNPGKTWRTWPYANSADKHRREGEEDPQFDHSYAERYWPKHASQTEGGRLGEHHSDDPIAGIRSPYGDLGNLIKLIRDDPLTRQAYLPVWFPEDLYGAQVEGRRVPCSLGYHFMVRNNRLHCYYPMRSCDFIRHFRDDVYLTLRLQIFIVQAIRSSAANGLPPGDRREALLKLKPGDFTMHMSSLHMFEQDRENFIVNSALTQIKDHK